MDKKKTKAIKDRILRDIKNLFKHEKQEENYYKPVRVSNFWRNNYIEYESNGNRSRTLLVEEFLNKIRPYLKDIINNRGRFRGEGAQGMRPLFFAIPFFFIFCNHFEELQTVLFEVELIIDNAPLTYVCPNTIETCLTPNH